MRKPRRTYSAEFKADIVKMVVEGRHKKADVSAKFDISTGMIRRWVRESEGGTVEAFPGRGRRRKELSREATLERELHRVRQERDILKKAIAIFSEPQG